MGVGLLRTSGRGSLPGRHNGSATRAEAARHGEDGRVYASLVDPQGVAPGGDRERRWRGVESGDVDEWKADDEQRPLLARGHSVLCADVITSDDRRLHYAMQSRPPHFRPPRIAVYPLLHTRLI